MLLALKPQKSHFSSLSICLITSSHPAPDVVSAISPQHKLPTVPIRSPTFRSSSTGQKPLVPGPRRIARRANALSTCHLKIYRCRSSESRSRRMTAVTSKLSERLESRRELLDFNYEWESRGSNSFSNSFAILTLGSRRTGRSKLD